MYMPNFHSIVRGNGEININLMALPFVPSMALDGCKVEEICPEYTDGSYYKSDGTTASNASYAYAEADVSKYKYVYLPVVCASNTTIYSGLRASSGSGSISGKCVSFKPGTANLSTAYALFEVDTTPYACISVGASMRLPFIGIIED